MSQVYVPDPAALGQYVHDADRALAESGLRVLVMTSARGYDDASRKYAMRETMQGVEVRRMPWGTFGKSSIFVRLLGALSFLTQVGVRGLFVRNLRGVLVSTSPPMCAAVAWFISVVRRVPFTWWVMDINPDQAVILGKAGPRSMSVKLFDLLNRMVLKRASRVVVLDELMAQRLYRKFDCRDKTEVIPTWPLVDAREPLAHVDNEFRRQHGLVGKLVFMYSGNHSIAHPISSIVEAARQVEDLEEVVFCFVGGGLGKAVVDRAVASGARNVIALPYQPLGQLHSSLSAADVHLVTLADEMVGVVHPCKVYGAMQVGRPVLLVGPDESHIGAMVRDHGIGWQVNGGDVQGLVELIRRIAAGDAGDLMEIGEQARRVVGDEFAAARLRGEFCDTVLGMLNDG